jgi:ferritin
MNFEYTPSGESIKETLTEEHQILQEIRILAEQLFDRNNPVDRYFLTLLYSKRHEVTKYIATHYPIEGDNSAAKYRHLKLTYGYSKCMK